MDTQQIKQILTNSKDRLFRTYPLTSRVFFSSYADGTATEAGAIDIRVDFSQPVGFEFIDLSIKLKQLLTKPVDIVTRKAVEPGSMNFIQPQRQYV